MEGSGRQGAAAKGVRRQSLRLQPRMLLTSHLDIIFLLSFCLFVCLRQGLAVVQAGLELASGCGVMGVHLYNQHHDFLKSRYTGLGGSSVAEGLLSMREALG